MSKRTNYYNFQKSCETKPFESKSEYNHDGKTIPVNNVHDLEKLATDYLCVKRVGTYYDAFEYTIKLIDILKKQTRAIEEMQKNFTV
jgi:hypothetical protein